MAISFITGYELSGASKIKRESKLFSDESASGIMRFVDLGAQVYYMLDVVIEHISESEMITLIDWIETNEKEEIDLTFDTEVYRGYFYPGKDMTLDPDPRNPNLYTVSFVFRGVRQ